MRQQFGIWLSGLGAAAAALSIVIAVESEVAAARPGVDPASVNRILKGDRMPLIPGRGASDVRPSSLHPRVLETPRDEPKLPGECSAVFNAKRNTFSTEVAGRCIG
jgi:hypothetical protein